MLTIICLLLFPRQMGAYHTIELELNRKFTLAKKSWDSILLDRIGKQLLLFVFDWDFSEFYLVTPTTSLSCICLFQTHKHTRLTYVPATVFKQNSSCLQRVLFTFQRLNAHLFFYNCKMFSIFKYFLVSNSSKLWWQSLFFTILQHNTYLNVLFKSWSTVKKKFVFFNSWRQIIPTFWY